MIREIINFTNSLIEDMPEVTQMKLAPNKGMFVFVDIDANGNWINQVLQKGKDYDYYDGKNQDIQLWNDCIRYQDASSYISMNKVKAFDSKQKIHSCSPFAISFNFKASDDGKDSGVKTAKNLTKEQKQEIETLARKKRIDIVRDRLGDYRRCSFSIYKIESDNDYYVQLNAFYDLFDTIINKVVELEEFNELSEKDYLNLFIKSVPIEIQESYHNKYLEDNLFNVDEIDGKGVLGFMTSYSSKKLFIQHKTSSAIKGISYRFSKSDAVMLNTFEKMWKRKCFPNPLPIVIDKRETNKEVVKIYNEQSDPIHYRELIKKLFDKTNEKELSDYYLLNYINTKDGMVLNDFDFVPLFRYKFDSTIEVKNVTDAGWNKNGEFEPEQYEHIENVFDFERIIVKEIFNNTLVKIKEDSYKTNYFGDIDPTYVSGGDVMYQLIMKYRKAFYDYIYKSQINALNCSMFDDIMFNSILTNIRGDEIKTKTEYNNSIKRKINIWFSIYNLFSNNKTRTIMASKITELTEKMKAVAKGEANLETPEEFAFGAGQLVSYLIDRSVASNKTYAMLEPYLQKSKSGQLQDAIAQTIAVYKHDISVYNVTFERLSSQVLTDDSNADMKPLLKFFLAGCFSPCAVYTKKDNSNE